MHRMVLAALLVGALAVAGAVVLTSTAHASDVSVQFGPGVPPGSMTLGGVTGPLSWSGNNWTMSVASQTFATGTFNPVTRQTTVTSMPGFASCQAGCTTTVNPTTLTGQLSFRNHGAFVSGVAHWAGAHKAALATAGLSAGDLISAAARGSAHPTGRSTATGAPATTVSTAASTTTKGAQGGATSSGHATGTGAHGGSGTGHGAPGNNDAARASASGSDGAGKVDSGHGGGAGRGR